jgi:SAM-dependent methyltransferase
MDAKDLKTAVRKKYAEIAQQAKRSEISCCGTENGCASSTEVELSKLYSQLDGYVPEADLMLGCGIPSQYAGIRKGDHVLDLGCGAGNDCFVVRRLVGETGNVTGLDFTPEMIAKAKDNNARLGYQNVEFVLGDIEQMPLSDSIFDVVISNCVLNLVPDKQKAFSEIMRVLKPGGHFCIADVVVRKKLPAALRTNLELYTGCIAGAMDMDDYLGIINSLGFEKVIVHSQTPAILPENLTKLLNETTEKVTPDTIVSIVVSGYKPQNN